jgi:hypothetical protein
MYVDIKKLQVVNGCYYVSRSAGGFASLCAEISLGRFLTRAIDATSHRASYQSFALCSISPSCTPWSQGKKPKGLASQQILLQRWQAPNKTERAASHILHGRRVVG